MHSELNAAPIRALMDSVMHPRKCTPAADERLDVVVVVFAADAVVAAATFAAAAAAAAGNAPAVDAPAVDESAVPAASDLIVTVPVVA